MQLKIFGREPSLAIGLAASILSVLVGFNLDWLSAGQAAAVVVVLDALVGAVNALALRPIAPRSPIWSGRSPPLPPRTGSTSPKRWSARSTASSCPR